jgi:hypothetical protein
MNYIRNTSYFVWLALGLLAACTDTETVEPPDLRTNRVLTYEVANIADPIYGAINDEDSTIKVYLPYFYYLNALEGNVTVSNGATVTPASGTLLRNVPAIVTGDTTVYYAVTAADGSTARYKLVVDTRQPELLIDELTTDPETPAAFYSSVLYNNSFPIYSSLMLTGENIFKTAQGNAVAKVTFIAEDGTEIPAIDANSNESISLIVVLPLDTDMPNGLYKIRVDCYSQSVTLENPIQITSPL